MCYRQWGCLHFAICFLVGVLAPTATETGGTPSATPTGANGEPASAATPSSGVPDGTDSTRAAEWPLPRAPTTALLPSVATPEACVCDLTPDFCDIGCCCDIADCGVDNLTGVFAGCPQKAIAGDCIEKWMMLRTNVNPSFVTGTDFLFCVHSEDDTVKVPAAPPHLTALGDSYHFSPPKPTSIGHSKHFYRADDVIQTYFSKSGVRGLLRQPSPGPSTVSCLERNPARFLRSQSVSCTRMVTPGSCTKDPNLSALSYFSDLSLVKSPQPAMEQLLEFLIPVFPLSDWGAPSEEKDTCINVAKKVEFVVTYTDRGELANATVNVVLAAVQMNQVLQQEHSVQFKLGTPSESPQQPVPLAGLRVGAGVIGRFNGAVEPVTIMGTSQGDMCSSTRATIVFAQNTFTGCTFSSSSKDCSEMRSQIYGILRGTAIPDVMAMNSGSEPDWTRVLKQDCSIDLEETCESGCTLPYLLSVQVLWARMGPLHLPQSYILGAKYIFQCRKFKCPLTSSIHLTTEVTFADMTVYPKPFQGFGST